jgi:hypothetical protein
MDKHIALGSLLVRLRLALTHNAAWCQALADGWVFLFKLLKELEDYYRQKEAPRPGYSVPSPVHLAQQESLIRVVVWFDN